MLNIDNLKECFKHAIENKMEYYERAYTYELILKAFNGIKIVGFTYGNSFDEIESNLYGELMNYENI